jgi:hypothetical protein
MTSRRTTSKWNFNFIVQWFLFVVGMTVLALGTTAIVPGSFPVGRYLILVCASMSIIVYTVRVAVTASRVQRAYNAQIQSAITSAANRYFQSRGDTEDFRWNIRDLVEQELHIDRKTKQALLARSWSSADGRTDRAGPRIAAIPGSDLQPTEGSALRPLCAGRMPPGRGQLTSGSTGQSVDHR